jgi:hypothetical protein
MIAAMLQDCAEGVAEMLSPAQRRAVLMLSGWPKTKPRPRQMHWRTLRYLERRRCAGMPIVYFAIRDPMFDDGKLPWKTYYLSEAGCAIRQILSRDAPAPPR